MQVDVKALDEHGTLIFEGKLNRREVEFMLQYAVNDLLMAGVSFHMDKPSEKEDEASGELEDTLRLEFPKIGEFH